MPITTIDVPASGTVQRNLSGDKFHLWLNVTLNPTLLSSASVQAQVSTDETTWSTLGKLASTTGITLAGFSTMIYTPVQNLWYWRLIYTNATVDSVTLVDNL